jgi:Flp pilus assembly protein TadG
MLRKLARHSSGNTSLLLAIGMPSLIGAAGLAVDMTQWYAWKRELQHAVDQAAIGAAWARTNSTSSSQYQTRGTQEFNANLDQISTFATQPTFQLASYANGNNNSVVVSASASKALPFSRFLLGGGVTVSARAQAAFAAGVNFGACLITVGDTGTTLSIGGNATVTAHCGMAALSCSDDAIVIDGSASVIADSIATCGTASVPTANQSVVSEGVNGLTDIFSDLSPPDDSRPRSYSCTGSGQNKQASLLPGTYSDLTTKCKTVLAPGIYVIDGGTLDLTGNYNVTGTNVMFVLKGGATIKLGGSGNNNVLNLTPMQAVDFMTSPYSYSSTLANRYANMLVFESRTNNATQDHIINGNSDSLISGTMYFPTGNVRVNGTADIDSSCLQITAWTITVLGNADLNTRCSTDQTNSAGSGLADVKLVA